MDWIVNGGNEKYWEFLPDSYAGSLLYPPGFKEFAQKFGLTILTSQNVA